jgi:serine/threonine-protein kinase
MLLSVRDHDAGAEREVASMANEALARFGMAGQIEISGPDVVLFGNGPTVSVELGPLLDQWDSLPSDLRKRKASDLARQLVTKRRSLLQAAGSGRRDSSLVKLLPLAILALGAAAAIAAYRILGPGRIKAQAARTSSAVAATESYELERQARARRVCDATRARVVRGATVGPTDVEGWVVELALLRRGDTPPLVGDPAFASFVAVEPGKSEGRWIHAGTPELKARSGPETSVRIADSSLPSGAGVAWRGVVLTFGGRYVTPFFEDGSRMEFVTAASALSDALGAVYGALYARCGHGTSHHLGAWFRGPNPGGAAAAVIYFMGTYADTLHVSPAVLGAASAAPSVERGLALEAIAKSVTSLAHHDVRTLIGTEGGAIAGRPQGPTTLTFGFRDGNRASRASHALARTVGIARD